MKTTPQQTNRKNKTTLTIRDEIWNLTKEIKKNLKELSVSQKETNQQMKRTDQQIDKLSASQKETNQQMQRTDQQIDKLSASQKETNQQIQRTDQQIDKLSAGQKETNQQIQKTDKKLQTFIGESGNGWGKLGENLVKGSLAQRLKERGIQVERVLTNVKNKFTEFDLVVINGKEVVVVEVKASLDPSDVDEFAEDIKNFKIWWPEFKDKTVYGAMAFLIKSNRQAHSLAQKKGFFVIEATGDVIIQTKKDFKPKTF